MNLNYVGIILILASKVMKNILHIEFNHIPEDRQKFISVVATQEMTDWLEEKGLSQKERVLTRFFITSCMLEVLLDDLPQLWEHLRELTKEEEEHGI